DGGRRKSMNARAMQFQLPPGDEAVALGADPIPAGPYYRAGYFVLEGAAIFPRTWLQIGPVCGLAEPGRFLLRPLEFAKASILITRAKDGIIRAFHNVCTHRGTQLVAEKEGMRSSFSCPYHMWTFRNDGELRAAPDFERFYVEKSKCNLRPVSIDVC